MPRDMTKGQFLQACEKYGFKPLGFLGYYDTGEGHCVSVLNAGDRRRSRLAYLVVQRDQWLRKQAGDQR